MSDHEELEQLKEMLGSPLIKKRKAGIDMAKEMLGRDLDWEQVRSLLEGVAKNDRIANVQEKAQKVLDEDQARRSPKKPVQADYVFGARCPRGHVNYYDKREYCPKQGNLTRIRAVDGKEVNEILIQCRTSGCPEKFVVEIDCEGYK